MWLLTEAANGCPDCQRLCVERDCATGIVGLERLVSYSYLKATMGSAFIARRAGI